MSTKLYLVESTDKEGENVSAIVEATDANDAVNQWHAWLANYRKNGLDQVGADDEETPPRQVFELPEKTGSSCFFRWHADDGVIEHEI
ncbi:hypothetical protein X766_16070 [Mesorhizobium sp. LSJC255A00]|uniref:hypothetical protein n=1 Tax=Mesorhizobium sp. LSJC255A00 TaxID=1287313 RepID=UPI0003CDFAD7|nr:hypothetical protein [Mesorhizobium sp. LSJC255A00]ESX17904.1 hypothetical protein X766_16070 [Mesorhizobium sp. LSJC255A00]